MDREVYRRIMSNYRRIRSNYRRIRSNYRSGKRSKTEEEDREAWK